MFRLAVDILRLQGVEQKLLGSYRILEAVEQSAPAEIVAEVLGGYPMESAHPAFQAAALGVDVLDMPNAFAAGSVVAGHETACLNAQARGHYAVTGVTVGTQQGIGSQFGPQRCRQNH